jgi:hypothetical protein
VDSERAADEAVLNKKLKIPQKPSRNDFKARAEKSSFAITHLFHKTAVTRFVSSLCLKKIVLTIFSTVWRRARVSWTSSLPSAGPPSRIRPLT